MGAGGTVAAGTVVAGAGGVVVDGVGSAAGIEVVCANATSVDHNETSDSESNVKNDVSTMGAATHRPVSRACANEVSFRCQNTATNYGKLLKILWISELFDAQPRNIAANYQPLNFAGAFKNSEDLCVTMPTLNRILARVTVTTKNLNRLFSYPNRNFTGLQL